MGFAQPSPAFPDAPRRSLACSLAFLGARQCSSRSSDAFLSALPCSPALPGAPWRSLALLGGRLGPLPPPGPPSPPLPGSLRGDYRGATPPTTTRREIEAKAKANAKGEKSGSERERRKKRKRRRRRKDLSHTPNRSADLKIAFWMSL